MWNKSDHPVQKQYTFAMQQQKIKDHLMSACREQDFSAQMSAQTNRPAYIEFR